MKIYVITKGVYSDYHTVAATTDLETAKKLAERFTDRYDDARIEEFDEASPVILPMWLVSFYQDGSVKMCEKRSPSDSYAYSHLNACSTMNDWNKPNTQYITVYVEADTQERAIKIAAEKRAEYLAQKEGMN